jgi:hypothetical protein
MPLVESVFHHGVTLDVQMFQVMEINDGSFSWVYLFVSANLTTSLQANADVKSILPTVNLEFRKAGFRQYFARQGRRARLGASARSQAGMTVGAPEACSGGAGREAAGARGA